MHLLVSLTLLCPILAISVTPHGHEIGEFQASVLGAPACALDLRHLASFPGGDYCNPICYKLTGPGGSYYVFHVDASGGANDISIAAYQAVTGTQYGGGFEVDAEKLPSEECLQFWDGRMLGGKANNYFSCPEGSFVKTYGNMVDIGDFYCQTGTGLKCSDDQCINKVGLDSSVTNKPICYNEYAQGPLIASGLCANGGAASKVYNGGPSNNVESLAVESITSTGPCTDNTWTCQGNSIVQCYAESWHTVSSCPGSCNVNGGNPICQ